MNATSATAPFARAAAAGGTGAAPSTGGAAARGAVAPGAFCSASEALALAPAFCAGSDPCGPAGPASPAAGAGFGGDTALRIRSRRPRRAAFSLVELITVIAVLAILAAIVVPVVGHAQLSARRARVRTQFAQWSVALEGFRAEYGYYPSFSATTTAPLPAAARLNEVPGLAFQTLTGRREDGAAPDLPRALAANPRRVAFVSFTGEEVGAAVNSPISDAFGNTDIVVLVDRDGDGLIQPPATLPVVVSAQTGAALAPDAAAFPAAGVRAGVLFYSAGAGLTSEDIVYSWR